MARASALHAEGHRFDSDILHKTLDVQIDRCADVEINFKFFFRLINVIVYKSATQRLFNSVQKARIKNTFII